MIGLGCLPDPRDYRDRDACTLGLSAVTPDEAIWRDCVDGVYYQADTNSCVGNAIPQAIDTWRGIHSLPPLKLSRRACYMLAIHQTDQSRDKRDDGTYIRDGIRAVTKHGLPKESVWPFEIGKHFLDPFPWQVVRQAAPLRGVRGYYRVYGADHETINQLRAAIARGMPVVFGVRVDEDFTHADGPNVIEYPRSMVSVGGHAMAVVGYRTVGGHTEFLVVNSWGRGWRDGGFAWLHEDWLINGFDRWVIDMEAA